MGMKVAGSGEEEEEKEQSEKETAVKSQAEETTLERLVWCNFYQKSVRNSCTQPKLKQLHNKIQ